MISYIKGELTEVFEDTVVVETNGIGYNIRVPGSVLDRLPSVGSSVRIYTYLYVKEDAMNLFGFLSRDDLSVFKLLLNVSGIGPKTAQRIILDLKDKVSVSMVAEPAAPAGSSAVSPAPGSGVTAQAILALEALGYAQADAAAAVRQVMRPDASVQDLIKESLTLLSAGY